MSFVKIKGFENYSINEKGIVKNNITNREKSAYINKKSGYLFVDLWADNTCTKKTIHRLVAEAFIPNPENKPTVDHINGIRTDNSVENLRWATYSEQNSRFSTIGVRSEKVMVTHENGDIMIFDKITDVAKHFNCNISNISQMLKKGTFGKRGKMRYYKFEYCKK